MYGDIVKINTEELRDKIHACWVGKNIGGTIGAPYEMTHDMLEITGFSNKPGEIIPNDDLDLQLVWLLAMEQVGPWSMNQNVLGEYWINYVVANYGEYGISKGNLRAGIQPGISGGVDNRLKDSNGGWIRSEVWACMCPGYPKLALKYSFADANMDHGLGEGTYAAMFTSAMQSLAFCESDVKALIKKAMEYVPKHSRVYKAVEMVLAEYEKGTDWKILRNMLLDIEDPDKKWFQAAPNIGFTVLGLVYGEGDYKKSVLMAVNCGDDTDCTAATVGATLGIMYGMEGIPQDWKEHVGDDIITICLDSTYPFFPKSCTELTERVISMIPSVFKSNRIDVEYTEGNCDYSGYDSYESWYNGVDALVTNSEYATCWIDSISGASRVEFKEPPMVSEGGQLAGSVAAISKMNDGRMYKVKMHLPQGWTAEYPKTFYVEGGYMTHLNEANRVRRFDFKINAGENVEPVNKIIVEMTVDGRPTTVLMPVTVIGR